MKIIDIFYLTITGGMFLYAYFEGWFSTGSYWVSGIVAFAILVCAGSIMTAMKISGWISK